MSFYVNFVLCLYYVIMLRGHIKGTAHASAIYSILYAARAPYREYNEPKNYQICSQRNMFLLLQNIS